MHPEYISLLRTGFCLPFCRNPNASSTNSTLSFLSSWLLLVLPLLLSMTLFAYHPIVLFALISVPTGLLLYLSMSKSGTPLPLCQPPVSSTLTASNQVLCRHWLHTEPIWCPWLLSPSSQSISRNLVKCETFGVSLVWSLRLLTSVFSQLTLEIFKTEVMDVDVGSFVFSQGVVSAIQIIKDPAYLLPQPYPNLDA